MLPKRRGDFLQALCVHCALPRRPDVFLNEAIRVLQDLLPEDTREGYPVRIEEDPGGKSRAMAKVSDRANKSTEAGSSKHSDLSAAHPPSDCEEHSAQHRLEKGTTCVISQPAHQNVCAVCLQTGHAAQLRNEVRNVVSLIIRGGKDNMGNGRFLSACEQQGGGVYGLLATSDAIRIENRQKASPRGDYPHQVGEPVAKTVAGLPSEAVEEEAPVWGHAMRDCRTGQRAKMPLDLSQFVGLGGLGRRNVCGCHAQACSQTGGLKCLIKQG